ncbi:MAG: CBS domain-containing protein [Nitrospirota bacterium]|nr:CBS domain-containing protein [Nitrospirota bacterium]MDH5586763.1 CBS domain-containing protein [Nitrospirota bacterium]MDH5775295.1 CBS domain-containing protein [Nitrospirota bacterium]
MRRVDYMVGARDFKTLEAEQFMQDVVTSFRVEDTVDRLAGAMSEGGFGSVPILAKDGKLVGIVSEFDLLKAIEEGKEMTKVTAGEIMVKDPITVSRNTLSMEIIQLLQERHFIRTPVVDADGKLVGVVSRRDIIQGYLRANKVVGGF